MSKKNSRRSTTKRTFTTDAFSNPIARLGFGTQGLLEGTVYPMTDLTKDRETLNSLYISNKIVENIISIIPSDITKKWFQISADVKPEEIDKIDKLQRATHLHEKVLEGLCWGRLYGGAVGIILIKGQEDRLAEPLDYNTIMPDSFNGLTILDRWCGITPSDALITDINDHSYGLPEYYSIEYGKMAAVKIHHSRIIRFTGKDLPPNMQMNGGAVWGRSELESLYEGLVKRDNVSHNMAALTYKALVTTIEMDNIDQLFAVGSSRAQKRFWDMIQAQSVLESNWSLRVINKGDNITRHAYSFSGLRDVYETIILDIASDTGIPVTKLFGRSPSGLNATGESDLKNYYELIETLREAKLRPVIEKLLPILALSAWGKIPDDLDFTFEAMATLSEKERVEIAGKKIEVLTIAYQNGAMDLPCYMKELKGLTNSSGLFANITNEMVDGADGKTYGDLHAMADPLAGLRLPNE